jgi:hypothetical protein
MIALWTKLSERDRRALSLMAVALLLAALVNYWPDATTTATTGETATTDQLDLVQRRRLRLQQMVATVPGKQDLLKRVRADVSEREKGLIVADTAAQAQAQLVQVLRQVGRQQNPPIELRGTEGGAVAALGDAYGQVTTTVVLDCPVEALVNYLTDLTRQKELLATQEIRVGATASKQKILNVRLTVSGVVPKRLVPEKKAGRL